MENLKIFVDLKRSHPPRVFAESSANAICECPYPLTAPEDLLRSSKSFESGFPLSVPPVLNLSKAMDFPQGECFS